MNIHDFRIIALESCPLVRMIAGIRRGAMNRTRLSMRSAHAFRLVRKVVPLSSKRIVQLKPLDVALIALGILLGSLGAICFKHGAGQTHGVQLSLDLLWRTATNPFIAMGFLLYVIPAAIWIYLLGRWPVSQLQPIMSLTYVCTPLFAMWLLGEPMSAVRWLGVSVIVVGVAIVAQS